MSLGNKVYDGEGRLVGVIPEKNKHLNSKTILKDGELEDDGTRCPRCHHFLTFKYLSKNNVCFHCKADLTDLEIED